MADLERESPDQVVYLLGAGASVEAGLPTATGLMKAILDSFNHREHQNDLSEVAETLNFVVSAMMNHDTQQRGTRPDALPNIEAVVSAVELLSQRSDLEVSPFVQSWQPGVDASRSIQGSAGGAVRDLRRALNDSLSGDSSAERAIRKIVRAEIGTAVDSDRFGPLHEELVRSLIAQLAITDETPLEYLNPLVELGRHRPVSIATLNYDLTIETAAQRLGIPLSRGVDAWNSDWRLEWPETGVHLMKLHGSIDWTPKENPEVAGHHLRLSTVDLGTLRQPESDLPFVVFGQREKLRPEGPFLELRGEFVAALRRSQHLVAVGYGFRDRHVNELIRRWIASDPTRILTVVDPHFADYWPRAKGGFEFELLTDLRRQDGADIRRILESRLLSIIAPTSEALPRITLGGNALRDELKQQLAGH